MLRSTLKTTLKGSNWMLWSYCSRRQDATYSGEKGDSNFYGDISIFCLLGRREMSNSL